MNRSFYARNIFLMTLLWFSTTVSAQLVLPGDYPDPSVVKINSTWWATATSSNWAPAFPLLKSNDLIHWHSQNAVFNPLPNWADYYFWAPEISYENGKVYVYYSAHKKNGNLCLGVASANQPEGPFTDLGPLMCEEAGSIDAFPIRDENGKLFLIWKEDGNSVKKPTPIWAMEMKEDRTALIGEKKELFRNDTPWEGKLVEGVSIMRHNDFFYAFYAGAGCCGLQCDYATGIARARNLLGPWEKYENNPVIRNDDEWICPGHGTPVEKDGRYFFLYHAYNKSGSIYTGRQGMLREFEFTANGWIAFKPVEINPTHQTTITDNFDGKLSDNWQWSVFRQPTLKLKDGKLILYSVSDKYRMYLGHRTFTTDYIIRASFSRKKSTAEAGIALVGDDTHMAGIAFENKIVYVYKLDGDQETRFIEEEIGTSKNIFLQIEVTSGKNVVCSFSTDGKKFEKLMGQPIGGEFLPPWDRAVRAGITAKGKSNESVVVDSFSILHTKP